MPRSDALFTAAPPMDPIAKTAYYCCGVRAADAASEDPICGDTFAQRFMDAEARRIFEPFARLREPNAANAARCRIVDDLLRERLQAAPERLVVLVGAGFDTRAFRLSGGRWVEFDQQALIALKEARLPAAQAPNPLQRMSIDFAQERLADRLQPWSGTREAVVVMEGVSMYLRPEDWRATSAALHRHLPGHTLVCDLMNATFERRFGGRLRREIRKLGGDFTPALADPAAFVAALGYRGLGAQSISARAAEHGSVRLPRWLLASLLRSLRDGYQVHVFEAVRAPQSTR